MNATMIDQVNNREYTDTLSYQNLLVNQELLVFAKQYYREKLDEQKIREITSMEFEDKLWLVQQYREEIKSGLPDLDSIY
jgi:hypothetical protein